LSELLGAFSALVYRHVALTAVVRKSKSVPAYFKEVGVSENLAALIASAVSFRVPFDSKLSKLVLDYVLATIHHLKVFNSIVELVLVDVMNHLVRKKLSPEMLFHNVAMHAYSFPALLNHQVALIIHAAISMVSLHLPHRITVTLPSPVVLHAPAPLVSARFTVLNFANVGGDVSGQ